MKRWSFIYASDIHVGTPRSFRYQPAWVENWVTARRQIVDLNPDLLLVGGDLTRDGCTHRFELEQIKDDLHALPFPVHVIPGNHEIGNKIPDATTPETNPHWDTRVQEEYLALYRSVFGDTEWSFVHKGVRFSAFNAFLAGSGLPAETEMWPWLEAQVALPAARHQVWLMHPALFIHQPDEPNRFPSDGESTYFNVDQPHRDRILQVFRATQADLVITGHLHFTRLALVDGIRFQYGPSTAFPGPRLGTDADLALGFLYGEVDDAGIHIRFIPLDRVSDLKGYGPGGNPPLDGRDYTVAQERPALDITEQRWPR